MSLLPATPTVAFWKSVVTVVLACTDLFQIIAFSDEEGIRFQTTFLGSSAIAGTFQPKHLKNVDARCGPSLSSL